MNCLEYQEFLQQHLDGQTIEDQSALAEHLLTCADCRALHCAAQRLEEAIHRCTALPPPAGLTDRILVRLAADRSSRLRFRRAALVISALAASLLAISVVLSRWPSAARPGSTEADIREEAAGFSSLQDNVTDASGAVLSLTRRAAGTTLDQNAPLAADSPTRFAARRRQCFAPRSPAAGTVPGRGRPECFHRIGASDRVGAKSF